MRPSRFLCPLL